MHVTAMGALILFGAILVALFFAPLLAKTPLVGPKGIV